MKKAFFKKRLGGEKRSTNKIPTPRTNTETVTFSLNKFLRLEVFSEIEDLPGGQAEEAAHGEDGEVQHPRVGRLVRVAHLLLALPHVGKVLKRDAGFSLLAFKLLSKIFRQNSNTPTFFRGSYFSAALIYENREN
jgi:hypothetical protein